MQKPNSLLIFVCLTLLAFPSAIAIRAQAVGALITVNSIGDSADINPGDGICADSVGACTLRAAVQEANGNGLGNTIIIFALPNPSIINLFSGPLTITGTNISIVGPGARRLRVQRSSAPDTISFRIFHIPNSGTNVVIRGLTISNGNSGLLIAGGAVRIGPEANVQLIEASIANNTGGSGGGISNDGNLTISRSLITSNTSNFQGGAIISSSGSTLRITNTTITGNSSPTGGAIWNAGSALLVNDTIVGNSASQGGRSVFSDQAGSISVLNTIVGNDPSSNPPSLSGTFRSLGNNLITDARASTGFIDGQNNDQVSDNNAIDPKLAGLADNGGQTDTLALLAGSPAINAGNSCVWNATCSVPAPALRLFWDQRRGFLRGGIFDAVDIGAYELSNGSASGGSFLFGTLFPPPASRYANSIAVFTNVATGEKIYRTVNPTGRISAPNLGNEIFVFEVVTKRTPGIAPALLSFPD